MTSRRPYLLRAMHEWISDNGWTPHIVVDASIAGVEVPRQYVRDGKIILNVSWTATAQLKMSNDEVTFSGRFGGVGMGVRIPIAAVLAVYARETGQGMIFPDDESQPTPPTTPEPAGDEKPAGDAPKRPKLTVVK